LLGDNGPLWCKAVKWLGVPKISKRAILFEFDQIKNFPEFNECGVVSFGGGGSHGWIRMLAGSRTALDRFDYRT